MGGDMMMPPPMNMDIAMMGPTDTLESMGMNPDGSGGAYESGTMDMGNPAADLLNPADPAGNPMDNAQPAFDGNPMDNAQPAFDGNPAADLLNPADPAGNPMDAAMGGGNMAAPTPEALAADEMDAAMGSAMDGAMDQGGPAGGDAKQEPMDDGGKQEMDPMADVKEDVDPSAGMG
jgi:hypothetical protein